MRRKGMIGNDGTGNIVEILAVLKGQLAELAMPIWPPFWKVEGQSPTGFFTEANYVKNLGTPDEGTSHHTTWTESDVEAWRDGYETRRKAYRDFDWPLGALAVMGSGWTCVPFGTHESGFNRTHWHAGTLDDSGFTYARDLTVAALGAIKRDADEWMTPRVSLHLGETVPDFVDGLVTRDNGQVTFLTVSGQSRTEHETQPTLADVAEYFGSGNFFEKVAFQSSQEFWWDACKRDAKARHDGYLASIAQIDGLAANFSGAVDVRIWHRGSQAKGRGD